MSGYHDKILSLIGVDAKQRSDAELASLFHMMLKKGMHGLCFSAYNDNQKPGSSITEDQIRRRIEIIKPHTKWIRSFSCTDGNELIPKIAHEYGLKTLVGAWIGKNEKINDQELTNLIKLSNNGYVDIAAVGNEVMYRGDKSEDELLLYIERVKREASAIDVGYVDAYYQFENHPRITEACDVILANCYPFWEGCSLEYSLLYMKDMYARAIKVAKGKKVIISETGWPNQGEAFHGATPSLRNALIYFLNTQEWSINEGIEIFYFSSFDEAWKVDDEGDVGAYWGLWDRNKNIKY
ncbi:MAG: glycosyl hydrolase family 17 protein [Bacteroidales bacterium]|jgi:glucan 1,3-beta-glucosidase|nr:glycosyl hydrolase [Lentimicrobiaceae bacterium]MDG1136385.1 glycosyl hydrolase family 17 protein [Bacteroidales bacterium]MDG1901776.1 glycosyl hydrolase family 17 protein [Bacteroidales bacterium]MDG2081342.1 glycosyl hydrolase family 17 protein [Bacteroidales bacterium]|tara:strand:+ start:4446 stop:5330 length:885 start_codon:yes stop_codon:yes gene_type:complete